MPGIITPQNERFGVHDMPPNECYDRIDEFVNANKNDATSFTADDDNQNMGLLCAHLANNQTRATNVALNRRQIVNYLMSHGYVCESAASSDSTAIRCVPEQQQQ